MSTSAVMILKYFCSGKCECKCEDLGFPSGGVYKEDLMWTFPVRVTG